MAQFSRLYFSKAYQAIGRNAKFAEERGCDMDSGTREWYSRRLDENNHKWYLRIPSTECNSENGLTDYELSNIVKEDV